MIARSMHVEKETIIKKIYVIYILYNTYYNALHNT